MYGPLKPELELEKEVEREGEVPELDFEIELPEKKTKRKKDLKKKKSKKTKKVDVGVDLDEELDLLNDFLGMIDQVKSKPKIMGKIIDKLENIVDEYREVEPERSSDENVHLPDFEELEEVKEMFDADSFE